MAEQGQCLKNARIIDPTINLCQTWVCEDRKQQDQLTLFCHCRPPYPPPPPGYPCPYGANSPLMVKDGNIWCACCCSCFAYGTQIAEAPEVMRPIEEFAVGDVVLAAGPDLTWNEAEVEFSGGVQPSESAGKEVIHVRFDDEGTEKSAVVTPDHVFFAHSRAGEGYEVIRAMRLVPGDRLVTPDGGEARVLATELGGWFKGLHHIATSRSPAEDLERHLLISDGIVSGDWAVQISDLDEGAFGLLHTTGSSPVLGSAEYEAAHDFATRFAAIPPGVDLEAGRPEGFRPYGRDALEIPADAQTFISRRQAEEVLAKGTQRPVSDTGGRDGVYYLFRLLNAFYPDVRFDLAWGELMPNAYSFTKYGMNIVVLSGGLVRTDGLGIHGLALVLAHEVGHLIGGPPLDRSGRYSCQGQADLTGIGAVLRGIYWMGEYGRKADAGLSEVEAFFKLIDSRQPARPDRCNAISLDCRVAAFRAGLEMRELPACAGGPKVPNLTVVGGRSSSNPREVELRFNLPVAPASLAPDDFRFDPPAQVENAELDPTRPRVVTVTADIDPKATYRLTIRDVAATSGEGLEGDEAVLTIRPAVPQAAQR